QLRRQVGADGGPLEPTAHRRDRSAAQLRREGGRSVFLGTQNRPRRQNQRLQRRRFDGGKRLGNFWNRLGRPFLGGRKRLGRAHQDDARLFDALAVADRPA